MFIIKSRLPHDYVDILNLFGAYKGDPFTSKTPNGGQIIKARIFFRLSKRADISIAKPNFELPNLTRKLVNFIISNMHVMYTNMTVLLGSQTRSLKKTMMQLSYIKEHLAKTF